MSDTKRKTIQPSPLPRRKPIATDAETNRLITAVCTFHGFHRSQFNDGSWMTVGLRGPAGDLALSLMKLFRNMAQSGRLPEVDIEAIENGLRAKRSRR